MTLMDRITAQAISTGAMTARKADAGRTNSEAMAAKQRALKDACQDFEAVLFGQMLSTMRRSVQESNLLGNSHGERIFQDMLDQEYAKEISRTGTTGLADVLYEELRKGL